MKMNVSPRRRAHFEREGLAKPGQRGLEKPGQAREGQKGQTGEPCGRRGAKEIRLLEARGVHPALKDGSPRGPWTVGLRVGWLPFGAPEPFQEQSQNPLVF